MSFLTFEDNFKLYKTYEFLYTIQQFLLLQLLILALLFIFSFGIFDNLEFPMWWCRMMWVIIEKVHKYGKAEEYSAW